MAAAAAAEAVEAAVEATVVAMGVAVRRPEAVYIRIKSIVKASISLSSTRKGYGSGVWIKGMDQSMDRGVWIVCSFGALIHTLYFDSYPYSFLVGSGSDVCVNSPSLPGVGGRGRSPLIIIRKGQQVSAKSLDVGDPLQLAVGFFPELDNWGDIMTRLPPQMVSQALP